MTNPLGQTERVEYQENLSSSLAPASDASVPSATGLTIDNSCLNRHSSFYWSRRQYADGVAAGGIDSAGFYATAQVTHWAESGEGSIPIPLSTKMPLESRVWYNYPGQSNTFEGQTSANYVDYIDTAVAGASSSPGIAARLLDGGATQASYTSYNSGGFITRYTDPMGRTTNYSYAANNIDLFQITQTNGTAHDVLYTATIINGLHEPLSITDAAGQVTTLTYNNSNGQLLTRTVVVGGNSQTTTLTYTGPSGSGTGDYLTSVTGPISGATTSYTFDAAERVHTVTDSEGYTITNSYDNLDRLTSAAYPDGTSDQTFYSNLDVARTIDRQGRTTYNQYDAIRELVQTTDPLGRTTKYTWCTCGGLSTLTDANGNVTTWGLDDQGRVTSKTYADSSAINYVYETNTSRLHTMTDARGNVATYSYNTDNTLSGTAYTPASGVATTPNVSFTYDSVYNRVTSMVDGTGTTQYSYNPVNGHLGAGRLGSVTVPIKGTGDTASVTYTTSAGATGYDELGRVVAYGIDQATTNANNVGTTFDALGRVTGVSNALGAFTYAYVDETSRLSGVTYPSSTGLTTNYSYFDNAGNQRLETIQNMTGSTQLSKFSYTYNPVGTIATWTQQADSSTAVINTLTYDNADQLVSDVQSGGGSASNAYGYDPAGNRLSETTGSGTTVGSFNNLNQLKSLTASPTSQTVSGYTSGAVTNVTVNAVPATLSSGTNFTASVPLAPGTSNMVSVVAQPSSSTGTITTQRYGIVTSGTAPTPLAYDINGNITTDENGNNYTWDALNRLTAIVYNSGSNSGTHTEFAYDGLSRRVQIVERTGTTVGSGTVTSTKNYLWIGSQIAEERDASNNVTKRFFPQGEQQTVSGTATAYYYTRDHLGSVREMCSSTGTITSRMSYDCTGRVTTVSGTTLPTMQFVGMYMHQTSGLQLTWFRAYDSNMSRWLSRDSLPSAERSQGPNLYEYAQNDGINLGDILGLSCGHCGPDVTDAVHNTLKAISASYASASPEDQLKAGQALFTEGGWDISQLAAWGFVPKEVGDGCCKGSVVYEGKCVYAGSLNYLLFGLVAQLSGTSLLKADAAVEYHKNWDNGDFGETAAEAFDFTALGYGLSSPGIYGGVSLTGGSLSCCDLSQSKPIKQTVLHGKVGPISF
jgi:RHS repeat-associated protein